MRCRIPFLAAAVVLAAPAVSPAQPPVAVVIVAGQSNATGVGSKAKFLPADLALQNDVWFDESSSAPGTPDTQWQSTADWVALQPSPALDGRIFGPEITLGRSLADAGTGAQVAVVKVTRPSTALWDFWRPPSQSYTIGRKTTTPPEGPGHAELMARIDAIKARLDAQVQCGAVSGYNFAGFVWMQGEADANVGGHAGAYPSLLAALVRSVRDRAGAPGMIAVVGQLSAQLDPSVTRPTGVLRVSRSCGGAYPDTADFVDDGLLRGPVYYSSCLATIRAAQTGLANVDPLAFCVNTDDLTLTDQWHFDSSSQMALGRRFAAALLAAP
jgi:hypothetical protein